jgi:phosphoglycolate phosphatase-like HAD superfamily hydrolase
MEQLLAGGKRRLLARTLRIDSFYPEGIMRDTKYATELCEPGRVQWEDSEGRIERILVKASGQEEIRFSWWKNGTIATRPLDLPEEDLIALMRSAIESGVFTHRFRSELRALLDSTM